MIVPRPASPDALEQFSVVPWLYWGLQPVHRVFLRLYFGQISIQGIDHLPAQGPAVLAPKHYSRWDPIVLALLSREPLWFMTNSNQFEGLQGWFIRRLGAFPVDVNRPKASSFRFAIHLLHANAKLVLFPEGGIVCNQPLRPLKPGLARLVIEAETTAASSLSIPIVPIALHYQPAPTWNASVTLRIGQPIYTADCLQKSDRQTAQAVTHALQTALIQLLTASES